MQYRHLRSLFKSGKKTIPLEHTTNSFKVYPSDDSPYIEPTIEKVIFENEKPSVILVSAVGVTGKTMLAKRLSIETGLPVLDLGTHKPVGDNSLTGLLTESFPIADVSSVLQGLSDGSFGIIVDGIDEGRSKTTEKAFEAFLDNLAALCRSSQRPVFIVLGRTVIMDDCWTYLSDSAVNTALVTIDPFSVEAAKRYIDVFSLGLESTHATEYCEVRDNIIEKLGAAFSTNNKKGNATFLAFMGYPPVLDSIVTLLQEEKNYYKLTQALEDTEDRDMEASLLLRIATYILERERSEKVIPNVVQPLVAGTPSSIAEPVLADAFNSYEQCARLIAYCLKRPIAINAIADQSLNERYEEQLTNWIPEHPFLVERSFRNAVFEALALATLMTSDQQAHQDLVAEYAASSKSSYHLVYMLDAMSSGEELDQQYIKSLVDAGMEFRSVHSSVEIRIGGSSWEESDDETAESLLDISIELLLGAESEAKAFSFRSSVSAATVLTLGPRLAGAFITVPCELSIQGDAEIELVAPVAVSARRLRFEAPALVLRPSGSNLKETEVVGDCEVLTSSLQSITSNGCSLEIRTSDSSGVGYPIIQHVRKRASVPRDPLLKQKYLRLKRILLEFRSHSRGALARLCDKIDSQRILKNEVGEAVLRALLKDGVMYREGKFYFLDPDRLHKHLGVSWPELRSGQVPDSMMEYIKDL